jgi:hypothetical protein
MKQVRTSQRPARMDCGIRLIAFAPPGRVGVFEEFEGRESEWDGPMFMYAVALLEIHPWCGP